MHVPVKFLEPWDRTKRKRKDLKGMRGTARKKTAIIVTINSGLDGQQRLPGTDISYGEL